MRVTAMVSSILFFAFLFAATTAEEPVTTSPPNASGQPSEEDLTEIAKIRSALGPEFRIASQAFAADLPPSEQKDVSEAKKAAILDASSPAASIYMRGSKPSVEQAIRFAKQAEHDLRILATDPSASYRTCVSGYTDEEVERLTKAAEKCRKLAEELESLTLEARLKRTTQLK